MPKVNCSVLSCSSGTYKINIWKKENCTEYKLEDRGNCEMKGSCLECKPPLNLHTFPGPIKGKQLREA